MSDSPLPQYIEFGANPRYQPPFLVQGCRMYNFVLEADYDRLQALFSQCLNTPAGGAVDFWPVGLPGLSYVMLNFVDMQRESSREANLGWVTEKECAIWMLGWDLQNRRFSWFIPYIFVDSDAALIVGRQEYGFPKRLGWFTFPPKDEKPEAFSLETLVIPQYDPNTQAVRKPLVEIRQTGEGKPEERTRVFTSFAEMCGAAADRVFDGHLLSLDHSQDKPATQETSRTSGGSVTLVRREIEHLGNEIEQAGEAIERRVLNIGEELGFGSIPLVFLKQFRDAAYADRACYQAIIASICKLTGFSSASFLGDYEITLFDYPSHPIRQNFGFPEGPLKPKLSFYLEYNFIVEPGSELWKAGGTT